jgi:hypothetical protein
VSVDFDAYIEARERPFWEPIGRYVFRFGMLERKVDEAISLLIGVQFFQQGQFILNDIDLSVRARLLYTLCRGSDARLLADMKKAFTDIEKQNTFRNTLVHGPWQAYITNYKDGETAAQKQHLSGTHRLIATNITPTEILANATKVNHLITEITRISQSVATLRSARVEPPPSPE